MASSRKGLSLAQQRLIEAFFSRTDQFFLTGDSALSGYYLHHRTSADLDFFTVAAETFPHGRRLVDSAVASLNGEAEVVREYPGFVELQAVVDGEHVKVDLVHDTAPQLTREKPRIDGAVIDNVEDIAANKVCATLGRAEVRDLIDLFFLARSGVDLERAVRQAEQKDAGVEPATLARVLGQVRIKEIPSTVLERLSPAELQAFVDQLAAAWARSLPQVVTVAAGTGVAEMAQATPPAVRSTGVEPCGGPARRRWGGGGCAGGAGVAATVGR